MQYCEQLVAQGYLEPWNAYSNVAFTAAALVSWLRGGLEGRASSVQWWTLWGLAHAIGFGSLAWHATHAPWAELADVVPILCFVQAFLYFTVRRALGYPQVVAATGCVLLAGAMVSLDFWAPRTLLNGSLAYLPVLGALVTMAVIMREDATRRLLRAAAWLFGGSLCARIFDWRWCGTLPHGTHWLWHLLNGAVIFLALESIRQREQSISPGR